MKKKKFFSVRKTLTTMLLASILFAGYSMYYKMKYWGFELFPNKVTNIWTIEANVAFEPTGDPIKVTLATPASSNQFKVLDENIIAPDYKIKRITNGNSKAEFKASGKSEIQNIYYRVMLYDNADVKGKTKAPTPKAPEKPILDEQKTVLVKEIIKLAKAQEGDPAQQIIKLLNKKPLDPVVLDFISVKRNQKEMADTISMLLSYKKIPSRIIRGIKLEEDKKSLSPDLMIEAYTGESWRIYNIKNGEKGIPENFVVFQRGGDSLLDVEGGVDSSVKFSVIKSVTSSFGMASNRAKLKSKNTFEYSIYNLPLLEQNTLKWFMIFPLAILIVVLMRNVIGLVTMGTFTPMLIAMSLVKTGLMQGLLCFTLIVGLGLLIRALLSKLNLLLVPRISAVVIFVILLMQMLTIFGYKFSIQAALSSAFFPIIITAWIIERASITWEEDGARNACNEVFFTMVVAIFTYFVINNESIRYIVFAFNELNLVVLFVVMLLGTYTGYRITELKRFAPLVKGK